MRKKQIVAVALICLVGFLFTVQAFSQVKKQTIKRRKPVSQIMSQKRSQALLFVEGKLRLRSVRSELDVTFVLKNNDANGEPVRSATITVNGVNIPEIREPGVYEGSVRVSVGYSSGCPVNVKIVTQDKREITSSGKIDSLLKLHISNIFPDQKDKIDVGEKPVTIRWEFVPSSRKPVDLTILNLNTRGVLYQKRGISSTDRVVIPVGTIPKRQKIEIYVEAPTLLFPINQGVHSGSFIKLFIKTSKKLYTHG